MTYKHDAVIRAWLDGKTVQQQSRDGSWHDVRAINVYSTVPAFSVDESYRIKPETIKYRRAIKKYDGLYVTTVNTVSEAVNLSSSPYFVRWIDTEWQEVEV